LLVNIQNTTPGNKFVNKLYDDKVFMKSDTMHP